MLLKMLSGEPLVDMGGRSGMRLQTQVQSLNWKIDDLLVTCGEPSDESHIAISCKGNVQVSGTSLPKDFGSRAWELWRDSKGPMRRNHDRLMLVTRGMNPTFQAAWTELKNFSPSEDGALALGRIFENPKLRAIFQSVKHAFTSTSEVPTDEETLQLVRHLHVVPTDFQIEPSEYEARAISTSRTLLVGGALEDAADLWEALKTSVKEARLGHGTISIAELWASLRVTFSLSDHPDFAGSWRTLRTITSERLSSISESLSNQFSLARTDARGKVAESLAANAITVVHGDSGAGKSALTKATLHSRSPGATCIWFGPDEAEIVANELERKSIGVTQPLLETLLATSSRSNVLVIDAAEKLSAVTAKRLNLVLKALVTPLSTVSTGEMTWRALVVAQTDGFETGLAGLLDGLATNPVAVDSLSTGEIQEVLASSRYLRWIAAEPDVMKALSNLRALGWVLEAETRFQPEHRLSLLSPTGIADRLWNFWTDGKLVFQGLLMRLAIRDAAFEHSVAISALDAAEASALENQPTYLPLRRNTRNRIEFQHDLASEWARFQHLKEIAFSPKQWATYVTNPLWTGALRMLGQFLLREKIGDRPAWDVAFETLSASKDVPEHATDVLLDALCLDPFAETLLNDRADFLFANNAAHLQRLLRRFLHIATVPAPSPQFATLDPSLHLYVRATQRWPVVSRWPPMLRFLIANHERVSQLVSPTVADICFQWLSNLPAHFTSGSPVPFRKELTQLALASARGLQVMQADHRLIIIDGGEKEIYRAAFAGTVDCPDEVSAWALEMAQRRPWRNDVVKKIESARLRQAKEHEEKMRSDSEYRMRHERKQTMPPVMGIGRRRLPPWPIGPKRRVDRHFREICAQPATLQSLMKLRPEDAAELLLATSIEAEPTEEYSRRLSISDGYGLEHTDSQSPTAYWLSPYFAFLQIDEKAALRTLIALVEFCTDRWERESQRFDGAENVPCLLITMPDFSQRKFVGDRRLLNWSHTNSMFMGALACGLAALEQWLGDEIENGSDVSASIQQLMTSCRSVGVLGVLLDVGKRHPQLFSGALLPFLTSDRLFFGDQSRVQELRFGFDSFGWLRYGDSVFNLARDRWLTMLAFRQIDLRQIARHLVATDSSAAAFLSRASKNWKIPEDRKAALEVGALQAELDATNYRHTKNESTGEPEIVFEYPATLVQEVKDYQDSLAPEMNALVVPDQCEQILLNDVVLSSNQAQRLADVLKDSRTIEDEDDARQQRLARVAAASTLLVRGESWLTDDPALKELAEDAIARVLAEGDATEEQIHLRHSRSEEFGFVAHAVLKELITNGPNVATDERILKLLSSAGLGRLMALAHVRRDQLGRIWFRLLELGVLWAALRALYPRHERSAEVRLRLWGRWLKWLRSRHLSVGPTAYVAIDLVGIAERVNRLERRRWARKLSSKERDPFEIADPPGRRSVGLDYLVIMATFGWLIPASAEAIRALSTEDARLRSAQLQKHLAFEVWLHPIDESEREPLPYQFGYSILEAMAWQTAGAASAMAEETWSFVLKLRISYHHFIGHFLRVFFATVARDSKPASVVRIWKSMLEFGLKQDAWTEGRHWHHGRGLLRSLLGFGSEAFLDSVPEYQKAVVEMKPLYEQWAKKHLQHDDTNISSLCYFVKSKTGAPLRLDALLWVAEHIDSITAYRLRDGTSDAIITLLNAILLEDAPQVREQVPARDALLSITAKLVSFQLPTALSLQEQARAALKA
jgi:hypothetical protein